MLSSFKYIKKEFPLILDVVDIAKNCLIFFGRVYDKIKKTKDMKEVRRVFEEINELYKG
jgi:uncharacterized membrane protein YjfL (UPF0719 family)